MARGRRSKQQYVIERLARAQSGLCSGCAKPLDLSIRKTKHPDMVTIDHTIPKALGGRNCFGNITAMHRLCNEMKGSDVPTGCEVIWLLSINCRLGCEPMRW